MAKSININREAFSFTKLNEIATEINQEQIQNKKKSYSILFTIKDTIFERYNECFKKFIIESKNFNFVEKKDFFRLVLLEFSIFLKSENLYFYKSDDFIKILQKKGKRTGKRTFTKNEVVNFSVGMYNDDTLDIFENILFSLAKKENFSNIHSYSRGYFFFDIVYFLEENISEIIRKHK